MPSKVALPINTFQLANGAPVANGNLLIRLSQPGSVDDAQINANFTSISLNSSGQIEGSPTFWPNADILPAGTYYILLVFSSSGQRVAGANKLTV
jgi:hypothetical protein